MLGKGQMKCATKDLQAKGRGLCVSAKYAKVLVFVCCLFVCLMLPRQGWLMQKPPLICSSHAVTLHFSLDPMVCLLTTHQSLWLRQASDCTQEIPRRWHKCDYLGACMMQLLGAESCWTEGEPLWLNRGMCRLEEPVFALLHKKKGGRKQCSKGFWYCSRHTVSCD